MSKIRPLRSRIFTSNNFSKFLTCVGDKSASKITITISFSSTNSANSSAFPFLRCKKKSVELAKKFNLAQIAGTDAHNPQSIGLAYTLLEADLTINSILQAILEKRCQAFGNPLSLSMKIKQKFTRLAKHK